MRECKLRRGRTSISICLGKQSDEVTEKDEEQLCFGEKREDYEIEDEH